MLTTIALLAACGWLLVFIKGLWEEGDIRVSVFFTAILVVATWHILPLAITILSVCLILLIWRIYIE